MKRYGWTAATLFLALTCSAAGQESGSYGLWERTRADHIEFYAGEEMAWLYGGIVLAAALANTDADVEIDEWYQESVRSSATDSFSRLARLTGEGYLTVPLFIGASCSRLLFPDSPAAGVLEEWGERSLRSLAVGLPPVFLLQQVTRRTRPIADKNEGWGSDPNKGVSGHAFMGAVPFIAAARMTERPALKGLYYTGSFLCAFSRVNDEGHYFSQVMLGWGLAYLAQTAVERSMQGENVVRWQPWLSGDYVGLSISVDF